MPKEFKFQYGNYNRYYGYRNQNVPKDPRLECFRSEWFDGQDVLDIGSNIGHVTLSIAKDFKPEKIVGIDIDDNLIRIAKRNISRYVDDSHSVKFMVQNYCLESDDLLDKVKPEFDCILCLSVTKWIHLNWGDDGLKRVFKRIFKQLRPGGRLILEPQPWSSYKKKKYISKCATNTFNSIKLKPEHFNEYLLSDEIGFSSVESLDISIHDSKGFQRPVFMFRKSMSHEVPLQLPMAHSVIASTNDDGTEEIESERVKLIDSQSSSSIGVEEPDSPLTQADCGGSIIMIYNFFIFDGSGNCLFALDKEKGDESLLFGFLFTMVSFSNRIAPVLIKEHNFFVCSTSSYQLVFMEMPTSVKFVIICSKDSTRTNDYYKQVIRDLYRTVYVEYHAKNPVIEPHATSIESDLFREKVVDFFSKM